MTKRPCLLALLPSLRISGGNKEIVRLVQEIAEDRRVDAAFVSMWRHAHELETGNIRVIHLLDQEPLVSRALQQLPAVTLAFRRLLSSMRAVSDRRVHLLLGHFSTYPLAWVAPSLPRICFNQDMEWLFVPAGSRRTLLKASILRTNRRSTVVTTNAYVSETYRAAGVRPLGQASIWADPQWLGSAAFRARDIDVLMLLRSSKIKRLDLYLEALKLFRARTALRIAVITPDTSIAELVRQEVSELHLRPSDDEMKELFARSHVFLLLSDVEGFGLPPLEGMGSGCVPVCRDSGGVRCYMRDDFAELLFSPETDLAEIVDEIARRLGSGALPSAETAQRAFVDGLEASRTSRRECIRRLQDLIAGTAPAAEPTGIY